MKRIFFTIALAALLTTHSLAEKCTNETKHCFKHEYAVSEDLFDRTYDCGFDPQKIVEANSHSDPFARAVIMLALYKQHYSEAKEQGHDKIAANLKAEMNDYIASLSEAGLQPEQIAKIPPRNKFTCHKVSAMQHVAPEAAKATEASSILNDVVEGLPKFKGKHSVINVFTTDSKHFGPDSKVDFCKLEACNAEVRTLALSESMCTELSNYMNLKESEKKFPAMAAAFQQQEEVVEKRFEEAKIPAKILKQLPAWGEFRSKVKELGCEKNPVAKKAS